MKEILKGAFLTGLIVAAAAVTAPAQTVTSFDDPNAGTASGQGTIAVDINTGGTITGAYIDKDNVGHGFLRTSKGGASRKGPDFAAFWEAVLGALLLIGALTLVVTNYKQVREINIFALVLVVQSLPFLSAVILAAIEGTRFNSFPYWRGIEAKAADLLPQPKIVADQPKLPADNRIEAAQ